MDNIIDLFELGDKIRLNDSAGIRKFLQENPTLGHLVPQQYRQPIVRVSDIVHLKSGSPDLRVVSVVGSDVEVEWRNEKGDLERSMFPIACVV